MPSDRPYYGSGNVPEFDRAILALLPEEGAKVGYKPVGATINGITRRLNAVDPTITPAQVQGRIFAMETLGQVVRVKLVPVSQGTGAQITAAGRAYLDEGEEQ